MRRAAGVGWAAGAQQACEVQARARARTCSAVLPAAAVAWVLALAAAGELLLVPLVQAQASLQT